MPDQEFKLLITGDASSAVAASQQAGDATRKLKVDTSDLSDETKRSLGLLAPMKNEAQNLGKEVEEAGKKMGESRREIREMGNELGRSVGLGGMGRAMLGGVGLAAMGAATAIEFFIETWKTIQESIRGPINMDIRGDPAKIQEIATALNTYAEARKKVIDTYNSPEAGAAREEKALENKLKLLHQILEAEEKEQLASLATKKDQMSPQAYAAAEAGIKAVFEDKNTKADRDAQQAKIDNKKKEAEAMDADAKAKRDQAGKGKTEDQAKAIARGEEGERALKEVEKNIERLDRIAHPDNPEYEGLGGKVQQQEDYYQFYRLYGYSATQKDARDREEQRKAQALAQIALGKRAQDQIKHEQDLNSSAAEESGKAETIRSDAKTDQAELDAQKNTDSVSKALGEAATVQGRMSAAENNNTPQGYRDAAAAEAAANKVISDLGAVLNSITDKHSEAYAAILKAYQNTQTELAKLARQMREHQFNSK